MSRSGPEEEIVEAGHITLTQGDDDTLRVTIFSEPETWIWIELDDQEVKSLIKQLEAWHDARIIGGTQP